MLRFGKALVTPRNKSFTVCCWRNIHSLSIPTFSSLSYPEKKEFLTRLSNDPTQLKEIPSILSQIQGGIKFAMTIRANVLHFLPKDKSLQPLDNILKDWLAVALNADTVELRRISFESSSGQTLEKVTQGEAVHKVRSLSDLKSRLSNGRRCYGLFHPSISADPLVFIHVAFTAQPANSLKMIHTHSLEPVSSTPPPLSSTVNDNVNESEGTTTNEAENKAKKEENEKHEVARVANFYSVNSPHPSLTGLGLAERLIKQTKNELQFTFPSLSTFLTLSPIPGFGPWVKKNLIGNPQSLLSLASACPPSLSELVSQSASHIRSHSPSSSSPSSSSSSDPSSLVGDWEILLSTLLSPTSLPSSLPSSSSPPSLSASTGGVGVGVGVGVWVWERDSEFLERSRQPMTWLCARYLCVEKKGDGPLDPVTRFHTRNGAHLLRLNWVGNLTTGGITSSAGMMVNYNYTPVSDGSSNVVCYQDSQNKPLRFGMSKNVLDIIEAK